MQLAKTHNIIRPLSLLLAFIAAARCPGSYFALFCAATLLLVLLWPRNISFPKDLLSRVDTSPLYFLVPYAMIRFVSETHLGLPYFQATNESISNLNITLLFLTGVNTARAKRGGSSNDSQTNKLNFSIYALLAFCAGGIISSLMPYISHLFLRDSAISIISGRPNEVLYGICNLLLAQAYYLARISECGIRGLTTGLLAQSSWFIKNTLIAMYILISWWLFRGAISIILILPLFFSILTNNRGLKVSWSISKTIPVLFCALLLLDKACGSIIKQIILRYLIYPFASANAFNGRLDLYQSAANTIVHAPLIGANSYSMRWHGHWTHSFILDTIIYHGWIAALFITAFMLYIVVSIVCSDLPVFNKSYFLLTVAVLGLAASIQPVEFTDGVAFQLTFICVGFIWGGIQRQQS